MRHKNCFWAMLWVFSLPMLAQEEPQLRDIKPVYAIPLSWAEVLQYALFGLLVAGLLAVAVYVVWRKMHRKPVLATKPAEPPLPPHELALRQLDELKAAAARLDDKAYYIRLTDIVREYLESRFDIQALEMTSEEILSALNRRVEAESLGEMLRFADLVKFAKAKPSSADKERAWNESYRFVQQVRTDNFLTSVTSEI